MNVTLQDALNATNDEISNYSTGVVDSDVKIRAINSAIDYIKRALSIPGDEKIQTIWFTEDQLYYDANADVSETMNLFYANPAMNIPTRRWEYANYPEILQNSGRPNRRRYGITNVKGSKQIVIDGPNDFGMISVDDFDQVGNWTDEADASGLALDSDQSYDTNGSLSFDITNSTGTAALQNASVTLDIDAAKKRHAFFKLRTYFTGTSNIDGISLKLYTDNSNYYTITATEQDDGTAFEADAWMKIGFALDDAIATGTPTDTEITKIRIEFDLGAGFVSAVDFRVDTLFIVVPDELELIYMSSYKGTAADGTTYKQTLTDTTDILSISNHGEDLVEVIAQRAAIKLWPGLRGDKEAYEQLRRDFLENMKTFSKRWPRRRTQNAALRTRIVR